MTGNFTHHLNGAPAGSSFSPGTACGLYEPEGREDLYKSTSRGIEGITPLLRMNLRYRQRDHLEGRGYAFGCLAPTASPGPVLFQRAPHPPAPRQPSGGTLVWVERVGGGTYSRPAPTILATESSPPLSPPWNLTPPFARTSASGPREVSGFFSCLRSLSVRGHPRVAEGSLPPVKRRERRMVTGCRPTRSTRGPRLAGMGTVPFFQYDGGSVSGQQHRT